MGKASSAKKVARAARAGGTRRPGQRRQLGFPLLIAGVVIAGTLLVVFARDSREVNAAPRSQANEESDHWHAALGIYQCDDFILNGTAEGGPFLTDVQDDPLGIHTHDDGVIHIHPFTDAAGGRNARMRLFFDDVGVVASDTKVEFPDGTVWDEGETTCTVDGEEVAGQIILARWNSAQDAADGQRPSEIFTEDFGNVRFRADREYFTFAFVPEGEIDTVPVRPDVIESLSDLSDVVDAPGDNPDGSNPDDTTTSTTAGDGATTTTVGGGVTTTTAAG
jgi:hypothetical protein